MGSKRIKVDKNQQIEKLKKKKKKKKQYQRFHVSYYDTLPNSSVFRRNVSHYALCCLLIILTGHLDIHNQLKRTFSIRYVLQNQGIILKAIFR